MTDRSRRARSAAIWDQLEPALQRVAADAGREVLDIVDVGGGSGVLAVPLAGRGHRVRVVDPSPNALATLERRASDAGVTALVTGVQGDAAALAELVGVDGADVVLCHGVLEVVDDPVVAVNGLAGVVRPGGLASVVAAQRYAAVIAKALSGHLNEARHLLDDPDGRWGPSDPLPRRFDEAGLTGLLSDAGLRVEAVHGVRVFTDLVPGALVDDPHDASALADLEATAVTHPAFRAVASALHVIARRPEGSPT